MRGVLTRCIPFQWVVFDTTQTGVCRTGCGTAVAISPLGALSKAGAFKHRHLHRSLSAQFTNYLANGNQAAMHARGGSFHVNRWRRTIDAQALPALPALELRLNPAARVMPFGSLVAVVSRAPAGLLALTRCQCWRPHDCQSRTGRSQVNSFDDELIPPGGIR